MRPRPKWLRALNQARDAVYVVNSAQRIICWNAGARKLLGYTEAEVLNHPCYQVMRGIVRGKPWCHGSCAVQRSVKRGAVLQTFDMLVAAKNGLNVLLDVSVFTFERKGRCFAIHLLRDLTREEQAKEALERVFGTLEAYGFSNGCQQGGGNSCRQTHIPASRPPSVVQLTRREVEVLELLAEGLSTRDLALRLGVSPFTIRRHIESILLKTGLHTQAQAVAYAYRAGLL